ncbi:MAG: hypothetical protein ABGY12_11350, partial [Candidatus Lambdaproteobacteria bacterium]
SSSSKWGDNSEIEIANAATLAYIDNQWETQGTLTKTGGTMSWNNVAWTLSDDTSYSSDTAIATKTLTLNNHLLTLASEDSDLTVTDNLTFENSGEQIKTGLADLTLQGGFILEDGLLSSTGGKVSFEKGAGQSGGSLDVSDSTLILGDNYIKTAGTLTSTGDGTILELTESLSLTSNTPVSVKTLNLNDKTITLGSETTDLTVSDAITLDGADEQIHTKSADLTLNGLLSVDNGGLYSSDGTLTFGGGLNQTGGELDIDNSTLIRLNADLNKTGGTLQTSGVSITVLSNLNITSNSAISAKTVELGDSRLSLGSDTSDLVLSDSLSLQDTDAFLNTGDADLTVEGDV